MCWICCRTVGGVRVSICKHRPPGQAGHRGLTREEEQHDPVDQEDWPEHGDVEDLEPAAEEADADGAGGPVPELELGEASNKGPELLVLPRGEGADGAVLHFVIKRIARGVELGRQEGEEQIQQVDGQRIGDYTSINLLAISSPGILFIAASSDACMKVRLATNRCTIPARGGCECRRG